MKNNITRFIKTAFSFSVYCISPSRWPPHTTISLRKNSRQILNLNSKENKIARLGCVSRLGLKNIAECEEEMWVGGGRRVFSPRLTTIWCTPHPPQKAGCQDITFYVYFYGNADFFSLCRRWF